MTRLLKSLKNLQKNQRNPKSTFYFEIILIITPLGRKDQERIDQDQDLIQNQQENQNRENVKPLDRNLNQGQGHQLVNHIVAVKRKNAAKSIEDLTLQNLAPIHLDHAVNLILLDEENIDVIVATNVAEETEITEAEIVMMTEDAEMTVSIELQETEDVKVDQDLDPLTPCCVELSQVIRSHQCEIR